MTSDFLLCWAILHLTKLTVYIFRPDYAPESSSEESEEEFIVKKTKQKSEVKEEEIQEEEIKDRRLRRLQVTIAIIKKTKQNWLCAQWRFRSAWAAAQSGRSLHCPHEERFLATHSLSPLRRRWSDRADAQTDWVLAGRTCFCWFCHADTGRGDQRPASMQITGNPCHNTGIYGDYR